MKVYIIKGERNRQITLECSSKVLTMGHAQKPYNVVELQQLYKDGRPNSIIFVFHYLNFFFGNLKHRGETDMQKNKKSGSVFKYHLPSFLQV